MNHPEQPSHEKESNTRTPIEHFDSELQKATSYSQLVMAMNRYLEREYAIGDTAFNQLLEDKTAPMPFPTDDAFHTDPDAAIMKVRFFIYGTLVPLYQDSHTKEETKAWLPKALDSVLFRGAHQNSSCESDIHADYEPCELGECPNKFVIATIAHSIQNIGYEFPAGYVHEYFLERRQREITDQLSYLLYNAKILPKEDAEILNYHLRSKIAEIAQTGRELVDRHDTDNE